MQAYDADHAYLARIKIQEMRNGRPSAKKRYSMAK
jgi:hypothetical protein